MQIDEQFNRIAEEYDKNRRKFIPCFDDFYRFSTQYVISQIAAPKRILDLGAGTGLLASFWYALLPRAEYVLADIADEMLKVARKRFCDCANVSYIRNDYAKKLPEGAFDAVISALSVHHLKNADKMRLFAAVYERLPRGGVFVNYDQFCADTPWADRGFNAFWENQLATSGLSENDVALWKERRKLDKECSVAQEIDMLKNAAFSSVVCLYSYHKFSVIAAVK